MDNQISLLLAVLNYRFRKIKNMGDYLAELETKFNKPTEMHLIVAGEMQVAILFLTLT